MCYDVVGVIYARCTYERRRLKQMNKSRKVALLYQKAKGQHLDASPDELRELSNYKISAGEGDFYTTKSNISSYVTDVDNGYRLSFYDWCMNNHKADRRRRGSSEKEIAQYNSGQNTSVALWGWLVWGIAIYWMFHGEMTVGACAIMGAIVSVVIYNLARRWAGFTLIILPIILAIVFGT
jgi:hypothetical protein